MSSATLEVSPSVRRLYAIPCDRCRVLPGFDFTDDGWWLCQLCDRDYKNEVAREAEPMYAG